MVMLYSGVILLTSFPIQLDDFITRATDVVVDAHGGGTEPRRILVLEARCALAEGVPPKSSG